MNYLIEYLNSNEINAILNSIDDIRDKAIISLFLTTGIFLTEAINLKTDSINWKTKILTIPGNRQREIPLNDQIYEILAKWSNERPAAQTTALFVTEKGTLKELSARSIDQIIRKYSEIAGIKKNVNAQILRNTFAVKLFSENVSIDKASAILGISDADSISRYIKASKEPYQNKTKDLSAEALAKVDTRPWHYKLISKLLPTKPKPAKALTKIKGPIITAPEEVAFGRDGVIEHIKSNLSKGQSVLLTGPLGIGKTHILKHLTKKLGPNTLYISSPTPIKTLLTQMSPDFKSRTSIKEVIDHLIKTKESHSPILIVDNLQNLRASDIDTFVALLENFTILASTEETSNKLKQIWWKYKQFEIKPLPEVASKELIKFLTQNLSISDYEMLENRVIAISNGLPLAIVEMIHQISHQPVVTREKIREVYHEAGIHYRDWTSVIVVLWGVAIIFRFIALGTHSFESYILAGVGIAFISMIRFFAFRMR